MSILSVVFQDFKLFSFSLGQNVAAKSEYDSALAEICLDRAGLENRLASIPNGLETCLYKKTLKKTALRYRAAKPKKSP